MNNTHYTRWHVVRIHVVSAEGLLKVSIVFGLAHSCYGMGCDTV